MREASPKTSFAEASRKAPRSLTKTIIAASVGFAAVATMSAAGLCIYAGYLGTRADAEEVARERIAVEASVERSFSGLEQGLGSRPVVDLDGVTTASPLEFSSWAREALGARHPFVIDANGRSLAGEESFFNPVDAKALALAAVEPLTTSSPSSRTTNGVTVKRTRVGKRDLRVARAYLRDVNGALWIAAAAPVEDASTRKLYAAVLALPFKAEILDALPGSWVTPGDVATDGAGVVIHLASGPVAGRLHWPSADAGGRALNRVAPWAFGSLAAILFAAVGAGAAMVAQSRRVQQRLHDRLDRAERDPLTGFLTRTSFMASLPDLLRRGPASVTHFDLDRLGRVNEVFGHAVGDAVIKEVARRLSEMVPPDALLGSFGGDEFVVASASPQFAPISRSRVEGIIGEITKPVVIGETVITPSVTAGAVSLTDGARSCEDIVTTAATALALSKRTARGRAVVMSEDEADRTIRNKRVEADLREAIAAGAIDVAFQPIFDVRDPRLVAVEALARWTHPVHGVVSPGLFMPMAEASDLIHPISDLVLRKAMIAAREWKGVRLAVNLSPLQFANPNLVSGLRRAATETGFDLTRLDVEITEGVTINDFKQATDAISALRSAGVRVSIDDFGTGYSSLSYLRKVPFDKLKVDRAFVTPLGADDAMALSLVRSIIALGHEMGAVVVAEGVETAEQLKALGEAGCDQVQGFLLARPMTADSIEALLREPPAPLTRLPRPAPARRIAPVPAPAAPLEQPDETAETVFLAA